MDRPIFEIELDTQQYIFVKNIKYIKPTNTQGLEQMQVLIQ